MVVGGTDARVGVHPWIARIGQNGRFFCGGALITAKHVVTAAHCLGKRGEYMVRLGDHDKDDDSDPGRIDVVVKAMIPHEKYLKAKQLVQNDIAILLLKESVKFTDRISPICLPMAGLRNLDLANRSVTVAGWGALSYGGEKAKVLQQANLIVTPHNECIQSYKSIKLLINNDQICANNPGKDACGGDSGGPLTFFYPESRRHYLVGIVSFGYKCADERFPGVYARTTSYMNWITEKVMNMN
ncbi:hypothetical protein QYM36_018237 [Artemia franciscana]|nr:hypothetical protein QYM36_018237 [Artemia franciscana]